MTHRRPEAAEEWDALQHLVGQRRDRSLGRAIGRARELAETTLRPVALRLDAELERDPHRFAWDVVREAGRRGWLGAGVPRAWGGDGLGITEVAVAVEELCAVDAGLALIIGAHGLGMLPLLVASDLHLAGRVLRSVTRSAGEERPELCAFAITEPAGGSDVEEHEGLARVGRDVTRAERVAGGYRLHGRKVFISNGSVARWIVVFAALDPASAHTTWTAFLVRGEAPGLSVGRVEHKMGQRACPAAELVLDGVHVAAAERVGAEGQGWELTHRVLAVSRGPVGAIGVGIGRGAYEVAVRHLAARSQRPEPWELDALSRMVVALRSARAAYLEASRHCDAELWPAAPVRELAAAWVRSDVLPALGAGLARLRDRPAVREAWRRQELLGAVAKIAGSDAAMAVTTSALDLIPPGAGEARRWAEKAFRDAKLTQIYEGTNQINLRAITHAGLPGGG